MTKKCMKCGKEIYNEHELCWNCFQEKIKNQSAIPNNIKSKVIGEILDSHREGIDYIFGDRIFKAKKYPMPM